MARWTIPIRRYSVRGNHVPLANGAPQYPLVGSRDLDLPDLLLIQRKALGEVSY